MEYTIKNDICEICMEENYVLTTSCCLHKHCICYECRSQIIELDNNHIIYKCPFCRFISICKRSEIASEIKKLDDLQQTFRDFFEEETSERGVIEFECWRGENILSIEALMMKIIQPEEIPDHYAEHEYHLKQRWNEVKEYITNKGTNNEYLSFLTPKMTEVIENHKCYEDFMGHEIFIPFIELITL